MGTGTILTPVGWLIYAHYRKIRTSEYYLDTPKVAFTSGKDGGMLSVVTRF